MDTEEKTFKERVLEILPDIEAGPLTITYLNEIWKWFMNHYTYVHDDKNAEIGYVRENWRSALPSIVEQIEATGDFHIKDDCDIVVTMAHIALILGWEEKNVVAVRCLSPQAKRGVPFDHYIGWFRYNDLWVVCDVWSPETRERMYVLGTHADPGHTPVDGMQFPLKHNGWKKIEKFYKEPSK